MRYEYFIEKDGQKKSFGSQAKSLMSFVGIPFDKSHNAFHKAVTGGTFSTAEWSGTEVNGYIISRKYKQ